MKSQAALRAYFWLSHPEFDSLRRTGKRQNDYPVDVRVAFVDADAARIVACVNACAGIEDPAAALAAARDGLNLALNFYLQPALTNYGGGDEPQTRNDIAQLKEALKLLTP